MDIPKKAADVGWFSLGFKPGEVGNAVIDGHLDTQTGAPAVFYDLKSLVVGDQIQVTDQAGKQYNFKVTQIQNYPFDQVPLQSVFGNSSRPHLNLITCQGTWDTQNKNYSQRTVVYTELE